MSNPDDRRLPVAFLVLAAIIAGLLLTLRSPSSDYLKRLREARAHANETRRTAAVAAYEEAARLHPDQSLIYFELARLYLDWGRFDEALDSVAEAERLGAELSDLERLRLEIRVAHAESSNPTKAALLRSVAQHAETLMRLDPDDQEARHFFADASLGLRKWDLAQSMYQESVRIDPNDEVAHERLGALLLGVDPAAFEHLYAARTSLSRQLLAAFQDAHSLGDSAYVSALLGRILIEHREWALAAHQLERAVSHNPSYGDAHAYLGHALDQMGFEDEAGVHLTEAIALAPDSAVAHAFLGLHYDRWGRTGSARAEYERAYDLAPDNAAICVEIGQTWAAEGRYTAAEIWLREAVSLRPGNPDLWEVLVRFYLDHTISSDGRAARAAEKLLELCPDDADAHDLRGWAALQIGDYRTAEAHLQKALKVDPMLASAHYHLGLLRSAQGRREEADLFFVHAVDLDTEGNLSGLFNQRPERENPVGEGVDW